MGLESSKGLGLTIEGMEGKTVPSGEMMLLVNLKAEASAACLLAPSSPLAPTSPCLLTHGQFPHL